MRRGIWWVQIEARGPGWIVLAVIPVVVLFLQFSFSLPVWNVLPKMRFLQYPWRWALVVEAPMAIYFAAAGWPSCSAGRWLRRGVAAVCACAFLAAAFFAGRAFLRVCDEGDTVGDLLAAYQGGGGLEGTDEYEPPGADHWKLATSLPDACLTADSDTVLGVAGPDDAIPVWRAEQGSCEATATAQVREPEHLRVSLNAPRAGFLVLRLVRYPAWRVMVNGRVMDPFHPADGAGPREDGLTAVPVPQGAVVVTADWTTTEDVVAGRALTCVALVLLIGLWRVERRRVRVG